MTRAFPQSGAESKPDLVIETMTAEQIGPIFAILRLTQPNADWQRWARFARRCLAAKTDRRGIITVRRPALAFPSGVACYQCESDFEVGRLLTARPFTAIDILDPAPLLATLATALVTIAQSNACEAVRLVIPDISPTSPPFAYLPGALAIKGEYTLVL